MDEAIKYVEKMTEEGAHIDCALFISADHFEVALSDLREACEKGRKRLTASEQNRLVGCFQTVYGG